jgi:hypothetical protein
MKTNIHMNLNIGAFGVVLITREQYLTFVTEWKARYRELSTALRQLKQEIREAQMEKRGDDVSLLCLERNAGRNTATEMLTCRAEMKVVAQVSYRASRTTQTAAV